MKPRPLRARLAAFLGDRRGNTMMIMGFAAVPLTFATGMVVDYSRAARMQTKLNALADASALAAVTTPMLAQPSQAACNAARQTFRNQMVGMQEVGFRNADLDITLTEVSSTNVTTTIACSNSIVANPSGQAPLRRTATVTYAATSPNKFGGVLGSSNIAIGGTSTTTAKAAPNIDFYFMLDVSSSMGLPVTTAGINFMRSRTVHGGDTNGCAFACHQTNPDNPNIRNASNQVIDYYTFAKNNNIELRVDAGKLAISSTIDRAQNMAATNGAAYRFSTSTFDRAVSFNNIGPLTANAATAKTQANNAQMQIVTKGAYNWDRWSEQGTALARAMLIMPALSGNGTDQVGDTPQAVLFLITDGMRDEESGGRQMGAITTDNCTLIKARGIRIGVLYTTYQPESVNYDGWSRDNILWRLPQVQPALQTCASPGLFFQVSTDEDISAALIQLFDATIETSRITN